MKWFNSEVAKGKFQWIRLLAFCDQSMNRFKVESVESNDRIDGCAQILTLSADSDCKAYDKRGEIAG